MHQKSFSFSWLIPFAMLRGAVSHCSLLFFFELRLSQSFFPTPDSQDSIIHQFVLIPYQAVPNSSDPQSKTAHPPPRPSQCGPLQPKSIFQNTGLTASTLVTLIQNFADPFPAMEAQTPQQARHIILQPSRQALPTKTCSH